MKSLITGFVAKKLAEAVDQVRDERVKKLEHDADMLSAGMAQSGLNNINSHSMYQAAKYSLERNRMAQTIRDLTKVAQDEVRLRTIAEAALLASEQEIEELKSRLGNPDDDDKDI